jgi:hypothetical protein
MLWQSPMALAQYPPYAANSGFLPPATSMPSATAAPPLPGPAMPPAAAPAYVVPPAGAAPLDAAAAVEMPDCRRPGGWLCGAGAYYLQPRWSSNPAFEKLVSFSTDSGDGQSSDQQDFQMRGQFAPLVWLGYVGDQGIGLRARWWQFHGSTSTSLAAPTLDDTTTETIYSAYPLGIGFSSIYSPDFNDTLQFQSDLTLNVTDFELLWDVHPGPWSVLLGAGVRYAHVSQHYTASLLSAPSDPTLGEDTTTSSLVSGHRFDGIGPVFSMEARVPLGSSGFSILGNARGALLLGTGTQQVQLTSTDTDSTGALVSTTTINGSRSMGGTVPVLELELGAEWARQIYHYRFVLQTALVGQAWFSLGNAAGEQNILESTSLADSADRRDTLGLLGFRLTAGLSY